MRGSSVEGRRIRLGSNEEGKEQMIWEERRGGKEREDKE